MFGSGVRDARMLRRLHKLLILGGLKLGITTGGNRSLVLFLSMEL